MVRSLRPLRAAKAQRSSAVVKTIPAPVGGWNARDSLAAMDGKDAVYLNNLFPNATDVQMRLGNSLIYGPQTAVFEETLIAYSTSSINRLFRFNTTPDTGSGTGFGTAIDVLAPKTYSTPAFYLNRWQSVNFGTPAGGFLVLVNGADLPMLFDGTTWTNQTLGGVSNAANLVNVNAHKFRLWFCENNTLVAWYLGTSAISGTLSAFDLSSIFTKGGYLMAMATWTLDAGYGVDDLAVFITSNGEVAVYRGTDPTSASTWALVGIFSLGSPIGRRCFTKFKGDLLLLNQDGLTPMSAGLQSSRLDPRIQITDKIQQAIANAISNYGSNFGWQVIVWPKESMLIINVPIVERQVSEQYIMNTLTGSWCKFQGWNAAVFEVSRDFLYFGGLTPNGYAILRSWVGTKDYPNQDIVVNGLQAFSPFGSPGQSKRFLNARISAYANQAVSIYLNIAIDFNQANIGTQLTNFPSVIQGALWDTATWDNDLWSDDTSPYTAWGGINGVGRWGAIQIQMNSAGLYYNWLSTDITVEPGAIL